MIYQRPTVASLQRWADDVNDQSYTFENMLPYYKKGMQFTPPDTSRRASNATAEYNPGSFDSSGPGQVSYANYAQTFSSYMEGGLNAIGMSKRNGFNDGELMGTAYCELHRLACFIKPAADLIPRHIDNRSEHPEACLFAGHLPQCRAIPAT